MNQDYNKSNGSNEAEDSKIDIADIIAAEEGDENEFDDKSDLEDIEIEKRGVAEELFEWIEIFSSALVTVILLFTFVFRLVTVEGRSMEKTLFEEDNLIISHMFYQPKQNDIVVIQVPDWWSKTPIIKRVIAVEGQTVDFDFENWKVIVDGVALDEPYVNYEEDVPMSADSVYSIYSLPLTVEKGKIFVMGDNRNHSMDSRNATVRQVDIRNVMGRVLIRVYPLDKFGKVKPAAQ